MKSQISFLCLLFLSSLFGCKEGTIIYDVEFPRADSDEAQGGGGGGGVCRVPGATGASGVAFLSDESQQLLMSLAGFNQLSLDAEANTYLARASATNPGMKLVRYDRLGRHQWSRQLGSPQEIESFGVSTDLYGNAHTHLTQSTSEAGYSDLDVVLAKYDSTGAERWARTLGSPADEMVLGSRVNRQGDLFATGFTFGNLENFVASSHCEPTFPSNSKYNYDASTKTLTVPEDLDNDANDPKNDQSFTVTLASGAGYSASSGDPALATVSAVASSTGEFTLSLKKNQHGSTTITASSSCGDQSFTLNVTSIDDTIGNRKNNQAYFTNAGDNFTCDSKSACFTNDNDTLDGGFVSDNWSIKTTPVNGTAGITPSGEWWYQPANTFNGREYFFVEVYDNDGFANEREICVASVADSSGPILRCQGQIGSTTDNLTEQNKMDEDGGTETGTIYFHDKNNQPLSYQIINLPDNGTAGYYKTTNGTAWLVNQTDNQTDWNYRPDENYFGTETFVIQFTDNATNTNHVEVQVKVKSVNDKPVPADISATITEDNSSSYSVNLSATDIEDVAITNFIKNSDPLYGTVSSFNSPTGTVTFTPFDNLSVGTYTTTLTYHVKDSNNAQSVNPATVTLTVIGANDQPVADNKIPGTITEGSPSNINLSATDIDQDDSIIQYNITSLPQHGKLTDNATGTPLNIGSSTSSIVTFTPFDNLSASFSQATSFTYVVSDNSSAANDTSDNATASLTVNGSNDIPIAGTVVGNVTEDSPATVTLTASDVDTGDGLTYSQPITPQYGTITNFNSATGTFTFTPFDNLSHNLSYTENLSYTVQDSQGQNSSSASVTLNLTGVNDSPVANSVNTGNINWGQSGNFTLTGSDIDGDNFTFTIIGQPQYAQISSFDNSTGSLVLTPNNNLTQNTTNADDLTFTVTDSNNAVSNTATVSFSVLGPICSANLEGGFLNSPRTVRDNADIFLTKYNQHGDHVWSRQIGSAADDVSFAVTTDSHGNTYVTGFTQGILHGESNAGGLDVFLIKFSNQGRELWRRQFGSAGDETGLAITTDEEANVYLTGQTNGNLEDFTNKGGKDLFVVKYDAQGDQQWIHQSGTDQDDLGTEISVDALGRLNLLSLTAVGDSVEQSQRFLNRFHPEKGQQLWSLPLENPNLEHQVLALDYTGNAFLAGTEVADPDQFGSDQILEYRPDSLQ